MEGDNRLYLPPSTPPPPRGRCPPCIPVQAQQPDGTHCEEAPLEWLPLPPAVTKHLPVPPGPGGVSSLLQPSAHTAIDLGDNITGFQGHEAMNSPHIDGREVLAQHIRWEHL